jgi:hypothetical protein
LFFVTPIFLIIIHQKRNPNAFWYKIVEQIRWFLRIDLKNYIEKLWLIKQKRIRDEQLKTLQKSHFSELIWGKRWYSIWFNLYELNWRICKGIEMFCITINTHLNSSYWIWIEVHSLMFITYEANSLIGDFLNRTNWFLVFV